MVTKDFDEPQLVIINSDASTVGSIKPLKEIKKQNTREAKLLIEWYNREVASVLERLLEQKTASYSVDGKYNKGFVVPTEAIQAELDKVKQ